MRKKLQKRLDALRERRSYSAFWHGFGSVLDISGSYFRPVYDPHDEHPFVTDALAIRGDWAAIGHELRRLSAG